MRRNIGIVGRKRSGKDTAANLLVDEYDYTRHGLADPLKGAALSLDPWIDVEGRRFGPHEHDGTSMRLSQVVDMYGWEGGKDTFPEVRRILQKLGDEAGRQVHGETTWILNLMRRVEAANSIGVPVVVPDVRYPNEADWLRMAGFTVVRIDRPGFSDPVPGEHASEQVEHLTVDHVFTNDGPVTNLYHQFHDLMNRSSR